MKKLTTKGAEALFAAAFLYAFTAVLVREVSIMWGDVAQVAARWTLVLILLLIFALAVKSKIKIPKPKIKYVVVLGFSFSLTVLFFVLSVTKTTVANSLFTFFAANMITSFTFGTLLIKEKVNKIKLLAIVFALIGLSLFSGAIIAGSAGIIFGIVAGAFGGISNLMQKLLAGVNKRSVIIAQHFIGAVFMLVLLFVSKEEIIRTISWRGIILTVIFALLLIAASSLLLYGFAHFDLNVGSVILASEIVFGAILGFVLYKEVPENNELLGGIFILIAAVMAGLGKAEMKAPQPD